jgi:hypothetical protein
MDRLAASELQELFEAEGLAQKIALKEAPPKSGHAGALDSLSAVISDPGSVTLLLLTAWIVSKKVFRIKITNRDPKTGKERTLELNYQQESPTSSVLTTLKVFFAGE